MSVKVMVNGLPGNMAKEFAIIAQKRGLEIIPYSLTGPDITEKEIKIGSKDIKLILPNDRKNVIEKIKSEFAPFISVDYTHPSSVNSNAEFYIAHDLPFVMGTTGGDRKKLKEDVDTAKLSCVIAPNMAKQIAALQLMFEKMQSDFPDLYKNYKLSVAESHQKTKADTSGTAKAIVDTFNKMGVAQISYDDIQKIRREEEQINFGVPQNYLLGHAFHTYRLESEDKTVAFEFKHNVCGRNIYAEGTVDATLFLANNLKPLGGGQCFSMTDVLKSGIKNMPD
ncbi:MAG: dihydrodipicolinate reductase [Chitinispirillales bacterium]|jgi:4-hydroxy-tetrahydrodipicolinate reductase|nr:dihydrodipicolinate reductase [Chitinispirillales bacterium]